MGALVPDGFTSNMADWYWSLTDSKMQYLVHAISVVYENRYGAAAYGLDHVSNSPQVLICE